MWHKLTCKVIYLLNRLLCRTQPRAEACFDLDERSSRYYTPTPEEMQQTEEVIIPVLDRQSHLPKDRIVIAGWRVAGWRRGTLRLQRLPGRLSGRTDSSTSSSLPSGTHKVTEAIISSSLNSPRPQGSPTNTTGSTTSNPPEPTSPSTPTNSTPTPLPTGTIKTMTSPPPIPLQQLQPSNKPPPTTPPQLSTRPLTPDILKRLLDTFDRALSHTHYAVSGHAALMVWGYNATSASGCTRLSGGDSSRAGAHGVVTTMPSHVSILCPGESKKVILMWARVAGWVVCFPSSSVAAAAAAHPSPGCETSSSTQGAGALNPSAKEGGGQTRTRGGEVIHVPLPGSSEVWEFRLRTVEDAGVWARLEVVRPLGLIPPYVGWVGEMIRTEARVVVVPTLLDEFARAWYFCVARGGGAGAEERERHIAGLMLWILRGLAQDAERYGVCARWRLTWQSVPCLAHDKFLDAFLKKYPEALGLLKACGLLVWEGPG